MQNRNHSAPILSEPKLSYFKHRLFETLTGGLNFESSKNTSILYKLFIYLVPLILIFLPAFLLESFYLAINVSGVAGIFLFLLNMIFQSNISYRTFPMKNNDSSENLNNTFSLKKPKKAKITYIAFIMMAIFLTYFHFFLTTAFLWNTIRNHDLSKEIQIFEFVLISLVTLTSAGSIFLGNPKEFASVLPDDKTYNLFSGIWMRPCFVIIVLIIQISYTDFWYNVIVSIIYFSLWPLWTFGMIGGLFNTFLWVLETINALLFGDGLKIKLRNTVLAFIFNIGLSFILATIIYFQADSLLLIYYLLLTVASLIKTLELDCFKNNKSVLSYAFLEILAVVIPVFVICIVFHQIFQLEYMYFEKNYQIILIILGTITAFFCSIHWMAGIQNRAVYLKILQNMCRNKSLSLNSLKILFRICQWTLCIFLLACSYGFSMRLQLDSERKILSIWLWSSLLLRSFNYCWLFHLKLYLILLEVII